MMILPHSSFPWLVTYHATRLRSPPANRKSTGDLLSQWEGRVGSGDLGRPVNFPEECGARWVMFCGQTDTGHTDDIYLYRSSPRSLAFWVTSTEHIMSIVLTSLLNRSAFRGAAAGGGGHTSGPICHPTRECSGLFQNIWWREEKTRLLKRLTI